MSQEFSGGSPHPSGVGGSPCPRIEKRPHPVHATLFLLTWDAGATALRALPALCHVGSDPVGPWKARARKTTSVSELRDASRDASRNPCPARGKGGRKWQGCRVMRPMAGDGDIRGQSLIESACKPTPFRGGFMTPSPSVPAWDPVTPRPPPVNSRHDPI